METVNSSQVCTEASETRREASLMTRWGAPSPNESRHRAIESNHNH